MGCVKQCFNAQCFQCLELKGIIRGATPDSYQSPNSMSNILSTWRILKRLVLCSNIELHFFSMQCNDDILKEEQVEIH